MSFPWLASQMKNEGCPCGFVVAGGHMKSLFLNVPLRDAQDVDIFMVDNGGRSSTELRMQVLKNAVASLKQAAQHVFPDGKTVVVTRTATVEVLVLKKSRTGYYVARKYQIMTRVFPSASHVVHGFDIDTSGLLFDGEDMWCTNCCARALANNFILFDHNKMSASGVYRYIKYHLRYGIPILLTEIPQHIADNLLHVSESLKGGKVDLSAVPEYFRNIMRIAESSGRQPRPPLNFLGLLQVVHFNAGSGLAVGLPEGFVSDYSTETADIISQKHTLVNENVVRLEMMHCKYMWTPQGCVEPSRQWYTGSFNPMQIERMDLCNTFKDSVELLLPPGVAK